MFECMRANSIRRFSVNPRSTFNVIEIPVDVGRSHLSMLQARMSFTFIIIPEFKSKRFIIIKKKNFRVLILHWNYLPFFFKILCISLIKMITLIKLTFIHFFQSSTFPSIIDMVMSMIALFTRISTTPMFFSIHSMALTTSLPLAMSHGRGMSFPFFNFHSSAKI